MSTKLQEFDLVSQEFKRDPFPTFAEMRAQGPIIRVNLPLVGETWLTTTFESANELLKNKKDFVQEPGNAGRRNMAGIQWWMPRSLLVLADNMLMRDEPDHRRLRSLVDKAFQRQGADGMRPRIQAITDELLDAMADDGEADLVRQFARPLPLAVICELLGLPSEDRPKFIRWCAPLTTASSAFGMLAAMPRIKRLLRYLREQFEICRRKSRPGMISALVEAEEAGDKLSENELLSMVFILLIAGHETTTHLISVGTLALLEHPSQKQALMADWSRVSLATEELLRYVTPAQFTKPRYAARDMVLHGHEIKRGEFFLAVLGAANSDPAQFERPEKLDLTRNPNQHLAFSAGIHFCLGLQLARAEAQVAFERLFTRFPDLELAIPHEDAKWTKKLGLRALQSLPIKIAGCPS